MCGGADALGLNGLSRVVSRRASAPGLSAGEEAAFGIGGMGTAAGVVIVVANGALVVPEFAFRVMAILAAPASGW